MKVFIYYNADTITNDFNILSMLAGENTCKGGLGSNSYLKKLY
jgi:hypothetical protein